MLQANDVLPKNVNEVKQLVAAMSEEQVTAFIDSDKMAVSPRKY